MNTNFRQTFIKIKIEGKLCYSQLGILYLIPIDAIDIFTIFVRT